MAEPDSESEEANSRFGGPGFSRNQSQIRWTREFWAPYKKKNASGELSPWEFARARELWAAGMSSRK